MYLPRGTWVHYWSGERFVGPAHILAHAPLGRPPIYARANTPLPLWPALMHEGAGPADPLTWLIFVAQADDGVGTVYDDAGEGFAFERGEYARMRASCHASSSVRIQLDAQEGAFSPRHSAIELDVRGVARPQRVTIDATATDDWVYGDGRLLIRLTASDEARTIEIV